MDIFKLLQPHTVEIYQLRNKEYQIENVPARSLLQVSRFDIYAKLFYIRNRKKNYSIAKRIYLDHIKAFNPDGKEPGRDDKKGVDSFLSVFDQLIDHFEKNDFDKSLSAIPVSENGIILDGAHRIASLAFYDKDVQIIRFFGVSPKCMFDANYFINRGLPWDTADTICQELLKWHQNILVACLWPRMGDQKEKEKATQIISTHYPICYKKILHVRFTSFVKLITNTYKNQPWVGSEKNGFIGATDKALNCYGKNRTVSFVFFQTSDLNNVLKLKEDIRRMFTYEKHSIHITDNIEETRDIASFVLDKTLLDEWLYGQKGGTIARMKERMNERILYFKKVIWTKTKVKMYSFLTLSFLKK